MELGWENICGFGRQLRDFLHVRESGGSFGSGYLEGVKMAKMNTGIINTVKRTVSEQDRQIKNFRMKFDSCIFFFLLNPELLKIFTE